MQFQIALEGFWVALEVIQVAPRGFWVAPRGFRVALEGVWVAPKGFQRAFDGSQQGLIEHRDACGSRSRDADCRSLVGHVAI